MIYPSDFKKGSTKILFNNEPWVVLDYQLVQPGKGGTYMKTKIKNLITGRVLEETFRSIENQYNLGASNFTDYQVASNNLFQAKSDQTRAKFDFIFKKKLLDFYQGKPIF